MRKSKMYFHDIGLWHEDTTKWNWYLKSLSSIIKLLGHEQVRLVKLSTDSWKLLYNWVLHHT